MVHLAGGTCALVCKNLFNDAAVEVVVAASAVVVINFGVFFVDANAISFLMLFLLFML